MTALLRVEGLSAGYGEAIVLEGIEFALEPGDSLALLGRNGMGKTTLLSTLMGATRRHAGQMRWGAPAGEADLAAVPAHRRAGLGLGWVPQERDIFPSLTVEENLTVGARAGPWNLDRVNALFPRLRERRANMGNELSGGEQQMLAMGRALMLNPSLLLLDEPLEGLAPIIVEELLRALRRIIRDEGMSAILVEQNAKKILGVTDRAIIIERGRVVHAADSAALINDRAALETHLGVTETGPRRGARARR